MPPKNNNTKYQLTWRHKSPENVAKHNAYARKCMKRAYDWNKIRMIFLRILL